MKKTFMVLFTGIVVSQYAAIHWWNDPKYVGILVGTELERPFVYRALMPSIIRWLSEVTGFRHDYVAVVLAVIAGVCLTFSLVYFLSTFYHADVMEIYALGAIFLFVILFQKYRMLYDLPNAVFFTLALAYMARRAWIPYLVIFTLSSFNRETTILLLPIFTLMYRFSTQYVRQNHLKYLSLAFLQILAFASIQVAIRNHFSGNGGLEAWIRPHENIEVYLRSPILTVLCLAVLAAILYVVVRHWKTTPVFLRIALICLTPVLPLHLFVGYPFEFRAMIELYPVILAIFLPILVKKISPAITTPSSLPSR